VSALRTATETGCRLKPDECADCKAGLKRWSFSYHDPIKRLTLTEYQHVSPKGMHVQCESQDP